MVNITDRHPSFFDKPPTKKQLRECLIESVAERYHLKGEDLARQMAEQLGTRIAVSAPDNKLLSYFRLADLAGI